ncbi:MAG: DUF1501 domain-containing protein [Saprospiraceae bacterium]|nr:DUF1501 domain-containing protein [Saprospiraceae bacterium]
MSNDLRYIENKLSRRHFLTKTSLGLGAMAIGSITSATPWSGMTANTCPPGMSPHFAPKAKRVVYLFMSGGPSQLDLYDYKPHLEQVHGKSLPDSIRKGQRLTGMSAGQSAIPVAASKFAFNQYGKSGTWISNLMPYTAKVVDDICWIKSMYTEAINHDPAITFFQSGSQIAGRPSIGAWVSYGLGSLNDNMPSFIVLISKNGGGQPLYARLWGNGFLPTVHQGVQFRSGVDPVLFLSNPEGYDASDRRSMLDYLKKLNAFQRDAYNDPEVDNRIAQYEMAFRMQSSVPEVTDLSGEPDHVYEMYGADCRDPGTYAANCLLARRLLERDVRFVQLYHQGWDQHSHLNGGLRSQCKKTDQPTAALLKDLKQRGLLEDTLVIWGGEFGRTVYSQGKLTGETYGRDHHPRCFTMWMAGAGVQSGMTYGETDDYGYNITRDPVHVHDFQATLMHLLGMDHEQLTFKYQGRRFRLTDVHGNVIRSILT